MKEEEEIRSRKKYIFKREKERERGLEAGYIASQMSYCACLPACLPDKTIAWIVVATLLQSHLPTSPKLHLLLPLL